VPPGTILGDLEGELAQLPAFSRAALIAPACHDTASAVAGIPAIGEDWGYISCGTWSLVGTPLNRACNGPKAREEQFTNLGGVGGRLLFQRNLNGMWLIKQCMDFWAATDREWEIEELVVAAENVVVPEGLLNVEDPELLKMGEMPSRINAQRRAAGLTELDEGSDGAPAMASLIFHSLAARYAMLFERMEELTGKTLERIFMVGGGSRNAFLRRLTSEASGKPVFAGSAESSTVGNFAVQLAALERRDADHGESFRESVAFFASLLLS
jgi:rhamnulokinase